MIMRWAIIGCGELAEKKIAPAMKQTPDCELYAIMRRDKDKANDFGNKFAVPMVCTEIEPILQCSAIDAVYIATPVYLHKKYAVLAAKHGKHIICEKPMAVDDLSCREMNRAAEDNHCLLQVAYYRRFYPKMRCIKQIIQSGILGRIISLDIKFYDGITEKDIRRKPWIVDRTAAGGGALMDVGSHMIDLALYCAAEEMQEVTAVERRMPGHCEVEESIALLMRSAGGGLYSVGASFAGPRQTPLSIYGTEGKLAVASVDDADFVLYDSLGNKREYHIPHNENMYEDVITNLQKAVKSGETLYSSGNSAARTAAITDAAYQSLKRKETVQILDKFV